eukprot:jgi/Picre1/32072/NNA_007420.t1
MPCRIAPTTLSTSLVLRVPIHSLQPIIRNRCSSTAQNHDGNHRVGIKHGLPSRVSQAHVAAHAQHAVGGATPDQGTNTVKVGLYIAGWYAFNIVFNILNKSCLNVFPAPWFLATFQLCASAVFMTVLWALGLQQRPRPVLSVILSQLVRKRLSLYVWGSLMPIIAGCSLAAIKEVSFSWGGFNNAMISNLGMVLRNVYSKKYLDEFKDIDGINMFALLSIISIFITAPVALVMEGFKGGVYQWGGMADAATEALGGNFTLFMRMVIGSGIFYHLYNQASYMVLGQGISPVTFSVGNTMKRVAVVVSLRHLFPKPSVTYELGWKHA